MCFALFDFQKPSEILWKYDLESEHLKKLKKHYFWGFGDLILATFGKVLGSKIEVKFRGQKSTKKVRKNASNGPATGQQPSEPWPWGRVG